MWWLIFSSVIGTWTAACLLCTQPALPLSRAAATAAAFPSTASPQAAVAAAALLVRYLPPLQICRL